MKFSALIIVLISLLTALVACAPQPAPTPTPTSAPPAITLQISGSGSTSAILTAVADEFEAANPGYILEVLPGSGTGGGVTGTIEGTLDLAALSRPANASETEQGIVSVQFGTSSTAIITHSEVGVSELTSEQVSGILTGSITNWSEVGGGDLPITLYIREPEEGNTGDIRDTYIGEAEFAATAVVMTSQTDMQNVVSSVAGAFGYATWATVVANNANVTNVIVDGLGVENPPETMTAYMGVGYLSTRASEVLPLVDWLVSEDGQAALQAIGVRPAASE